MCGLCMNQRRCVACLEGGGGPKAKNCMPNYVFFPDENVTLDGENGGSIQVGQIRCDEKHFAWEKKSLP